MADFDWNNLRVVLAISRTGSLTAAASHLQMDQTTVGRRLSNIEQNIGAALFLRAKSGFIITEAGETVVAAAKVVENRLETMAQKLIPDAEATEGIVRILGNGWMLSELAEKALPSLLAEHPGLEVRFVNRLPPTPLFGEPTVALWFDASPRATDRAIPFASVPFATYRAADMADDCDDWVIFRDDNTKGPSFARVVQRKLGNDARVRMTGTDAAILASAARAGIGQALLPVCLGDRDPSLVRSKAMDRPIERVLQLHTSPEFEGRARLRTIVKWLEQSLPAALQATPIR